MTKPIIDFEVFISTPINGDFTHFNRVVVSTDMGIDEVIRTTRKDHNRPFFVVDPHNGIWVTSS